MNLWNIWGNMVAWISPVTGDKVRPWLAAIILIVSIIVLVVMLLVSRRSGDNDKDNEAYRDEDGDEKDL